MSGLAGSGHPTGKPAIVEQRSRGFRAAPHTVFAFGRYLTSRPLML
jgi:hypothetical protein